MGVSISTQQLTLGYGNITVIENLNLNFKQHTFTALVGNNGSGKSTFLRSLCGLNQPLSGYIKFHNQSEELIKSPFKSGLIGFLAQNTSITFDIGVKELLLMGRFRFKKKFENYTVNDLSEIKKIAEELNITSLLMKQFNEISGGEQQLVLIAQTLLQDAQIYLFDEPTQNLDLKNASFIMNFIAKMPKKGKTVICSTHDLHLLEHQEGEMINFSAINEQIRPINEHNLAKHIGILKET